MHASLHYHRPHSVSQACALLRELGPNASALAGGTDLLVGLRAGTRRPTHLVSLRDLEELRHIEVREGHLRIGALVTPAGMEASEVVGAACPEMMDVVEVFGNPQVRVRATVGGNLCTAASCADLAPFLMVLGARVALQGPEGRRELTLEEFFQYHRKTGLRPGEILVDVAVPVRGSREGAAYQAFGRRATNFITVAGVAAFLRLDGRTCLAARVALGAVAPTPILVPAARDSLVGSPLDDGAIRAAAQAARAAALPISDVRGSAEHRRELVEALCVSALKRARARAGGEGGGGTPPLEQGGAPQGAEPGEVAP